MLYAGATSAGVNLHDNVVKVTLSNIIEYSSSKISADTLSEKNYVGVDNLLPNKQGKKDSTYVPTVGKMTKFVAGDVLVGNIRPYLRKIWHATINGGTNGDVLVFQIKENKKEQINSKYLFQILSDERFFEYNARYAKGAKMPRGDKRQILNYEFLLPSLAVQNYVVNILDNFDKLIHDITQGLPKEIELRQKQYIYYRDKLLNFTKE